MAAERYQVESEFFPHLNAAPIQPEIYDKPGEECGLVAVYAPGQPVATLTLKGMYELQHRGQCGAGIYVNGRDGVWGNKGAGKINEALYGALPRKDAEGRQYWDMDQVDASIAIGHLKYSTTLHGKKANHLDAHPHKSDKWPGGLASGENGNIINLSHISERNGLGGKVYSNDNEEFIDNLTTLAVEYDDVDKALDEILPQLDGAYNFTILDGRDNRLIVARDPHGYRPLSLAKFENGGYMVASERVAFEAAGATFIRDVEAGEILTIDDNGLSSRKIAREVAGSRLCSYEFIYFARPDSVIEDRNVWEARFSMGQEVARQKRIEADVVIGVPHSGLAAAQGYADASGIPWMEGFFPNPYASDRTFIDSDDNRPAAVRGKLRVNKPVIEGKRLIVVDDSVIRGSVSPATNDLLWEAGAKEIHFVSAAPKYLFSCFMGMDTSNIERLLARGKTDQEIATAIHANTITFNTVEGLKRAIALPAGELCVACSTGEYEFSVPGKPKVVNLNMPRMREIAAQAISA